MQGDEVPRQTGWKHRSRDQAVGRAAAAGQAGGEQRWQWFPGCESSLLCPACHPVVASAFHPVAIPTCAPRRELESVLRRYLDQAPGPRNDDAAASPLPETALLVGLLAGMSVRTQRKTLRRWVRQGRQLPTGLAVEAAAALAGVPGPVAEAEAVREEEASPGVEGEGGEEAEVVQRRQQQQQQVPGRQLDQRRGQAGGPAPPAPARVSGRRAALAGDLQASGHLWHGQQLVARLQVEEGDAGLAELCRRFRQRFVEALRPEVRAASQLLSHWQHPTVANVLRVALHITSIACGWFSITPDHRDAGRQVV